MYETYFGVENKNALLILTIVHDDGTANNKDAEWKIYSGRPSGLDPGTVTSVFK